MDYLLPMPKPGDTRMETLTFAQLIVMFAAAGVGALFLAAVAVVAYLVFRSKDNDKLQKPK